MSILGKLLQSLGGGRPLRVGDRAPDFTLEDSDGQEVSLAQAVREGPVILAFYPRAFTLGCTNELRKYTARQEELRGRGARLFAISVDDPPTLARFKARLGASFTFLSDPGGKVAERYAGVSRGQARRTTITIDQGGTITRVTAGVAAIFPADDIVACTQLPSGDDVAAL